MIEILKANIEEQNRIVSCVYISVETSTREDSCQLFVGSLNDAAKDGNLIVLERCWDGTLFEHPNYNLLPSYEQHRARLLIGLYRWW